MKSFKNAFAYGVLVWALPFIFSIIIFFLHSRERALFESLMSVFGIFTAVLFTNLYFKNKEKNLKESLLLGIIWVIISLSFDFLLFIVGPIKMDSVNYIKDIGIVYISIPIITVGYAVSLKSKNKD